MSYTDKEANSTQSPSPSSSLSSSSSSSSTSCSSPSSSSPTCEDKKMSSNTPIQPSMSQGGCLSAPSNTSVNSTAQGMIQLHTSSGAGGGGAITSQAVLTQQPNQQTMNVPIQAAQQIQASVTQQLSNQQQSFGGLQHSRIPTPQPQQIVNQNMAANVQQQQQPQQMQIQPTTATSQFASPAAAIQAMNIQLQQHSQMMGQAQQQPTSQHQPMQATTAQVHHLQTNQQQATHQLVQQHHNPFNISQGQSITVSMNQPSSGTPTAHIAPAPGGIPSNQVPQLQVIQHPMQNSAYIHPIYATGAHQGTPLMFPSNLTIQSANMGAFQSLATVGQQTRNVTFPQQANIDPNKQPTAAIMPVALNNNNKAVGGAPTPTVPSVVNPAGQVQITNNSKPTVSQMINAAANAQIAQNGKSVFGTTGGNNQCANNTVVSCATVNGQQTFVIGQIGVLSTVGGAAQQASTATILPAKPGDPNQKPRSFTMGITSPVVRTSLHHHANKVMSGTFQSKSPILPHPVCSTATVIGGTHFKQMTSAPQVISSQASAAMIASQPQILGSFPTAAAGFASPGQINWASPNCLQSPATMGIPNAQIVIRGSQNGDMYIQSPAQPTFQAVAQQQPHLQVPTAIVTTAPVASVAPSSTTTVATTSSAPQQKPKQATEQNANILPKSNLTTNATTSAVATPTISSTTRNLSNILPASNVTSSTLPTAQVRPASSNVVQNNNNKNIHFQNKVKARPRLSPSSTGHHVQGQARQIAVNQPMPSLQPKPRMPSVVKPTTVAQKLASASISPQTRPSLKVTSPSMVPITRPPSVNVNVVAPEMTTTNSIRHAPKTYSKVDVGSGQATEVEGGESSASRHNEQVGPSIKKSSENKENNPSRCGAPSKMAESNGSSPRSFKIDSSKEKNPQKAIVKPNVLTHVIEGFVILEASEPFPVNRSSSPALPDSNGVDGSSKTGEDTIEPGTVDASAKLGPNFIACEYCRKSGVRSTFPGTKRFCSRSCAKRYNVGCTARVGMFKNNSGKVNNKKRKTGGIESTGEEEDDTPTKTSDEKLATNDEKMPEPPLLQDESRTTDSLSSLEEMDEEGGYARADSPPTLRPAAQDYLECYNKNPVKWNVEEVHEFIQSLPGCSDYAQEFLSQEIDGQALMLLKEEHLVTTMNVKLGPALKICSKVSSLRAQHE